MQNPSNPAVNTAIVQTEADLRFALAHATALLSEAVSLVGSKAYSPGLQGDIYKFLDSKGPAVGHILQTQHQQVRNDALEEAAVLCEQDIPKDVDGQFKVEGPQSKEDALLARRIRARKTPARFIPAPPVRLQEPTELVCGHCNADRFKEPCAGTTLCSMVGTAYDKQMCTPPVREIALQAA